MKELVNDWLFTWYYYASGTLTSAHTNAERNQQRLELVFGNLLKWINMSLNSIIHQEDFCWKFINFGETFNCF